MWSKDFLKGHGHWLRSVVPRSKGSLFFCSSEKCMPTHSPPKFVRGCIFSPKSGKKQNTVLFYFSWNYFALQAVNFIGGALIKIKVKSCHCSTSFYPYLCCIFFWTITISFLYFPKNCSNQITHSFQTAISFSHTGFLFTHTSLGENATKVKFTRKNKKIWYLRTKVIFENGK